jgi:hypothetical protein
MKVVKCGEKKNSKMNGQIMRSARRVKAALLAAVLPV